MGFFFIFNIILAFVVIGVVAVVIIFSLQGKDKAENGNGNDSPPKQYVYLPYPQSWPINKGQPNVLTKKDCTDNEHLTPNFSAEPSWCVMKKKYLESECNKMKLCGGYGYPNGWRDHGTLFGKTYNKLKEKLDWNFFEKNEF